MPAPDYLVQSLARAAQILKTFSSNDPELTIGEIAQRSDLPRSTVHRLVVNLVRLGFLTRDSQNDRYRLGLLLVELGAIALSGLGLRQKAHPVMETLAGQTGEAVLLAVLDHDAAVYIEKIEGRHSLRMTATVGRRSPLHCTATGTVLLASLTEAEARRIVAKTGLPRYTAKTITEIEPLMARLAEVRQRGYAVDDGESEDGLAGIAVPVRASNGDVIAALVVAGPGQRLVPEGRPELAPLIMAAANEISTALGYSAAKSLVSGF